jgi:hypothetical protein
VHEDELLADDVKISTKNVLSTFFIVQKFMRKKKDSEESKAEWPNSRPRRSKAWNVYAHNSRKRLKHKRLCGCRFRLKAKRK